MPTFRLGKCKKGGFLQGGGATFWQAKNGGFWGPGGARGDAHGGADFESNSKPKNRTDALTRHSIRKQKK
jgi:hypothetical protein